MNKVILKGNFVKDAEIKANQNGDEYAYFTLAVKRDYKNANGEYDADFIRCIAFGNNANLIKTYFKKGSPILIDARIRTGNYEDNKGNKVYTTDVVVDHIDFIEKKETTDAFRDMGIKVEQDDLPF